MSGVYRRPSRAAESLLDRLRPSVGVRYPAFDAVLDRAVEALTLGVVNVRVPTEDDRRDLKAALAAFQGAMWAELAGAAANDDEDALFAITETITAVAVLFGVWLGQSGLARAPSRAARSPSGR